MESEDFEKNQDNQDDGDMLGGDGDRDMLGGDGDGDMLGGDGDGDKWGGDGVEDNWGGDGEMDGPEDYPQDYSGPNYSDEMEDDYGNWQGPGRSGGGGGGGGWRNFNHMNRGPPPGFFPWGRGFGPGGPPIQRGGGANNHAIRHLLRCGVPREQLKNVTRAFLELIEPDYCRLCDVILDNFHFSRAHYLSKLHAKNQKRWAYHQFDDGGRNMSRKELPMKSRDLFCELCNVQITSKVHADSHYDGKSHRAIVEGRKDPKNPALLKRGKEGRIKALIRRERKHLKAESEIEKDETQKQPKANVPPELYCNICQTSVTCTEQMTMHLNGKRHLSKEKQHILKMMTGKTDDNENDEEKQASDDQKDEAQEGEAGQEGEDKYDWGNGSGAWEEAPQ